MVAHIGDTPPASRSRWGVKRKQWFISGALAALLGLLLPFPGPHISSYTLMAWVLAHAGDYEADTWFYILWCAIYGVYSTVLFAIFLGLAIALRHGARSPDNFGQDSG